MVTLSLKALNLWLSTFRNVCYSKDFETRLHKNSQWLGNILQVRKLWNQAQLTGASQINSANKRTDNYVQQGCKTGDFICFKILALLRCTDFSNRYRAKSEHYSQHAKMKILPSHVSLIMYILSMYTQTVYLPPPRSNSRMHDGKQEIRTYEGQGD